MLSERLWSISAAWLALATALVAYLFLTWLLQAANPLRHEYGIGAAVTLLFAWPAALGLVVLALPELGVARNRRLGGLAICAVYVAVLSAFEFVQA